MKIKKIKFWLPLEAKIALRVTAHAIFDVLKSVFFVNESEDSCLEHTKEYLNGPVDYSGNYKTIYHENMSKIFRFLRAFFDH